MSLRRVHIVAAAMGLSLATAAVAAADPPWLEARQDDGEVRFTSQLGDDPFSFRIPGRATRQAEDGGFVEVTVDTAPFAFQVLWANPDQDSLGPIADGAKENARKLGAAVAPSEVCAQAKAAHREWAVSEPGSGTRTIVVAFETASGALVMRVVDDAGMVGARKLRAACTSFARPESDRADAKAGDADDGPGGD